MCSSKWPMKLDMGLYLVGGPVRDLRLDRASIDADVAVEGDAGALAREFAGSRRWRGPQSSQPSSPPPFTCQTTGSSISRPPASEDYARPGALPTVRPASIQDDLLRRDFSINAMAIRLNGASIGELIDPAGGVRDLEGGPHPRPPREQLQGRPDQDPTRQRATRLASATSSNQRRSDWLMSDVTLPRRTSAACACVTKSSESSRT